VIYWESLPRSNEEVKPKKAAMSISHSNDNCELKLLKKRQIETRKIRRSSKDEMPPHRTEPAN
jgi:hypothetical protein